MIFPFLVFSSISPTFDVMKYPTPIFILVHFSSFLSFIIMTTAKIVFGLVGGGGDIAVDISKCAADLFILTESNKKCPDFVEA